MIDGSYGEGGGQIIRTSLALSLHTRTNIEIIRKFPDVKITTAQLSERVWRIDVEMR
jgi:RNA 3'-terminal phosphate cyclase